MCTHSCMLYGQYHNTTLQLYSVRAFDELEKSYKRHRMHDGGTTTKFSNLKKIYAAH